ncbi:urea carboxylase-associated protein 2 [Tepidimonas sediminis]|uniref:Urea carboxylase-associated protein 2 n=1 Tax=Tepidimonas sediminis TaxID=2588941 RepID=A0A554WUS7_9BURK|nr:urea amidolyase associated protein UAAP1 [Tepidimonas sediminis]TSE27340.1 urea carboxylase-associated protein 2 [Tepidimonas sediminis]
MAQHLHPLPPERFLWEERLPGGCHWSGVMRRGSALRLTDLDGRANVAALFFNAEEKLERYNMADTLKAQHTAYLTAGHVCYSDMGRVLCSIVRDTSGWHDTVCGVTDAQLVRAKYGVATYQTHRNAMYRNGRDGLLIELAKWGLGKRDLVPNVNFFSRVAADEEGRLTFDLGHGKAGACVDLRFEMNVLVVLSAAPHPLDPRPDYAPGDVMLTAWRADPPGPDDLCRNHCPENQRGFYLTEILFR